MRVRGRRFAVALAGVIGVVGLLPAPAASAAAGDIDHAGRPVQWQPCADAPDAECATVTVPIDWSRPWAEKIDVALARRKASDPAARLGSLLMDPGGPGGSGADVVKFVPDLFSPEVMRRYDVIGFDPRGVGASHPVLCHEIPLPFVEDPKTAAEFHQMIEYNRAYTKGCRESTGKLFDFVDTASVARDMDAIRAALREPKLNYLGISYGTLMGQQYAELFPHRIGRVVIDSNMDHSLGTADFVRTEAVAAEESFDQFVAWCNRNTNCALHGQNVRAVHTDLLARAERGELIIHDPEFGDVTLSPIAYLSNLHGAFYGPDWFDLAQFLVFLRDGGGAEPTVASTAAGALANRGPAARRAATNQQATGGKAAPAEPVETFPDAFAAVFCQDWRLPVRDFGEVQRLRQAQKRAAPDMTMSVLGWGATLACVGQENRVRNPQHALRIVGGERLLMVNSRYDPATPWQWATNAAAQSKATLLRYDGWGHFAYGKSQCVVDKVDNYLLTTGLPARNQRCAAVEPPLPDPTARSANGQRPAGPPTNVGPRGVTGWTSVGS